MNNQGCLVPALFMLLGFGWLILNDFAKDQTVLLVSIKQYPDQTFTLSEYSLDQLEEKGSLKIKCGKTIFNVKANEVSKIKGDFELTENEVTSCDRF
ncbi:hypothetical protein cce_4873 [Crocosphaera subtropica ATCC 51142]|uniref:Uncharacterized protein n=1 Tax=Crocosphaera subtropica (strain ATCC 51142 / BH68) TaxID=43989 RepID=B1X259_CROS5|nr:hypothetical protein [Crocosphaera subtropica]ACB54220.1 hypothetical protein cce_4873 [Crocosphaera subtropica ATCC 51142]